jgi:hypothetical protein
MKFYRNTYNVNYWNKINKNKLSSIYIDYNFYIWFFKNGKLHNNKNAANINHYWKGFWINNEYYGNDIHFTKKSWRKFARELKLKAFL